MTPFLLHRAVLCSASRVKESKGKGIKVRQRIREEFRVKEFIEISAGGGGGEKTFILSWRILRVIGKKTELGCLGRMSSTLMGKEAWAVFLNCGFSNGGEI